MNRSTVQYLSIALFVALLGWGAYTFLYYLGVPVHTTVLVKPDVQEEINAFCNSDAYLCRGMYALFPFLIDLATRVPFFTWYALICLCVFAAYLGWRYMLTSRLEVSITMKPWKLLVLFAAMTWLLFTCLSLSKNGDMPYRTLVEPLPQVYKNLGDEAIAELRSNYEHLKDSGCLHEVGVFGGVAKAFNIKVHCLQGAFFTRVVPPGLVLLLFLFTALVAGRLVLRRVLFLLPEEPLSEFVVSMGVGFGAWIILLWFGALFGIYTALFGWALMVLIPVVGFFDAQYWIDRFLHASWRVESRWYSLSTILVWFLLSYLAFNYINVIRPFPIGWDDLGSYLNRPRLLVSYGKFVHSMASFQWEYITSLGFLLFGLESIFGATTAMVFNWVQGLFAVLVVILFGRTFLGSGRGVLSATLYYTLPLVGHFSFADMKIDNAVFAMGALALFSLFVSLFKEEQLLRKYRWYFLSGAFAGLAFSLKATGIMVFMTIGAVLAGVLLHWSAFFGMALLVFAVYTKQGTLNIPSILDRLNVSQSVASPALLIAFFVFVGLGLIAFAIYRNTKQVRDAVLSGSLVLLGALALILPWIWHNSILAGSPIPRMSYLGAPNTLTPQIDFFGSKTNPDYALPPELVVDRTDPNCTSSAGAEELDRYWGNHVGWGHYLTLPWRTVMNLDHAGYYVTPQPAVLLFILVLLLPFFWKSSGRWLRWLWIGTAFLVVQWSFLANGVVWYGIGMFFGLVICVEALLAKAPDMLSKSVVSVLVTLSILMCLSMRFWQYETQRNLFEYAIGKVTAAAMRERTIPHYDDITDIVLQRHETMKDRPLVYRIGTFIPYFVPRNLEVIGIADHQLDTFNCLYQEEDNALTLKRIKALGFNSIIFDTNTATIEKNPNGTLHRKVNKLVRFLNSPEAGLQPVINDPGSGIVFLLIP